MGAVKRREKAEGTGAGLGTGMTSGIAEVRHELSEIRLEDWVRMITENL